MVDLKLSKPRAETRVVVAMSGGVDSSVVAGLLAAAGHEGPVDAVVSCLGMSLLPPELRQSILASSISILGTTGVFVQYGYLHARVVVYSPIRGWSRFNLQRYLQDHFGQIQQQRVIANFPPADVFVCRQAVQ